MEHPSRDEKVVALKRTRSMAPGEERPADAPWRNSLRLFADHTRKERRHSKSSPPSPNRHPISLDPVNGISHLRSRSRRPSSRGGTGGNRPLCQGIIRDQVSISIYMPLVEERRVEEGRLEGVADRRRGWAWDVFDKLLEGDEGGGDGGGEVEKESVGWIVLKLLGCFFQGLECLMPLLALLAKGHSGFKLLLVIAFIPFIGIVITTLASQRLLRSECRMVGRLLTLGSAVLFAVICFTLPKQGAMDSIGAVRSN